MQDKVEEGLRLLPEDLAALRRTYAPYWGEIYLAGRRWTDVAAGETIGFGITIAGDYTLLSSHPVVIDGQSTVRTRRFAWQPRGLTGFPRAAGRTICAFSGARTCASRRRNRSQP